MSDEADREHPKGLDAAGLPQIWRRIHEHKMVQWCAAYAALAYGVQHAIVLTSEAFDWPHVVQRATMLILVLGVPLAITFAWYQGARASRNFSQAELSILTALLVIGSLLFYVFVRPSDIAAVPALQQASVTAARQAAASPKGAISVAVLPFLDLSPAKDQEFFSDGMTEEITAALAKVPDLRVVARTSAFEFKGKNVDIENIGQQLHATHLIEGSVRKAGNRLRITAQLIKADDGTHIWAEDYDRELTDVFAIQEDIARAITASLHMTLGLKPGENLVNNRSIDRDAYEKFLRARALSHARVSGALATGEDLQVAAQVVSVMENILSSNPAYAPAWEELATAYAIQANRDAARGGIAEARATVNKLDGKVESALKKTIQLDPTQAESYSDMAWLLRARGHPLDAEQYLEKSLALDPVNSNVLFINGMLAASAGRLKEALDFYERGHAVDPLFPNLALATAQLRWLNGQNEAAIALAKTLRTADRAQTLALIYASMGRFGEAADALMELAAGDSNSGAAKAARLMRTRPSNTASPEELARLPRGLNGLLFLYLGAPQRALEAYERQGDIGHVSGNHAIVWHPAFSPVRKTELFKALMKKVGLVDYWRARGYPPQCHPTTGDDFVCE